MRVASANEGRNSQEMDSEGFKSSPLSRLLDRHEERSRRRRAIDVFIVVGGALLVLSLLSKLPSQGVWLGQALIGAGLAVAFLWGYRSEKWFLGAIALNSFVTLVAFVQFGRLLDETNILLSLCITAGWMVGFGIVAFLAAKVPTEQPARSQQAIALGIGLLVITVIAGLYVLIPPRLSERESSLRTVWTMESSRASVGIEECFNRRKRGPRRFSFDPDRPDQRFSYNLVRKLRWVVTDLGTIRRIEAQVEPGQTLSDEFKKEMTDCAGPRSIDLYGNVK